MTSIPTRPIGYVNEFYSSSTNGWWRYDEESTPELRWPLSVVVYDAMRTQDAQVGSVLEAVMRPVLRTPWRIDPAGARSEVVKFVADDLGLPIVGQNPSPPPRTKDRFSWLEHLELALLMLPYGHSYFEQIYRVDEDGNRAHLGKLEPRMPRTIDRIDVARDGGLISITQRGAMDYGGTQRPIPVDRLVAYVYKKEGGNWLGRSILRQAYKNWLIKDRLLRVQAQTIERNGMGIPKATDAEGASPTQHAENLAMAKALRSGETSGIALPFGATMELMGVSGQLPDAQPAIDYHDNQIARAVLAHFLNLGQQAGTGSYALGVTFADFFTLSLQTLAQQIADVATMHIVEDLVDKNWGPTEPAPKVTFDEIGSRQQATAAAVKSLVDAGILEPDEVLEESTRQQYGLPPKDPATTRGQDQGGFADALTGGQDTGQPFYASAGGADPKGGPVLFGDEDDDEPSPYDLDEDEPVEAGSDDEAVEALLVAVAEFAGDPQPVHAALSGTALSNFNALHPRNPHGQFRTVVQRLRIQLLQWALTPGNDPTRPSTWTSDPFHGFSRDQLRRAAIQRGHHLQPRVSRDDIVKVLALDLSGRGAGPPATPHPTAPHPPSPSAPTPPAAPSGTPARPPWPTTLDAQVMNDLQAWINAGQPNVDPLQHYSNTHLDIAARHLGLPGGQRRGPQLQQHAIATLTPGDPVAEQPIHPNRVGGVTGVTVRPIPPNSGFGGHQMRQSQEVYVNGTKIGEIDAYGTRTWGATSVAGSSIGLGGNTRLSAIQSLVAHHQAGQARVARQAALNTNVPGVTLTHLNSAGTGVDLDVQYNGNYVGNIHEAPNGYYFAVVPVSVAYTLQGGTGPNGTGTGNFYPAKDAAVQALVDAHNLHQLGQAVSTGTTSPSTTPYLPATRVRLVSRNSGISTYDVYAGPDGGTHIGQVETDPLAFGGRGGWQGYANPTVAGQTGRHLQVPGGPYRSRQDAVIALNAHVAAQSLPPPTPTGGPGPNLPNGITIDPFVSNGPALSSAHAYYGGLWIGGVHEMAPGDWMVFQSGTMSWPITLRHFATQQDALEALHLEFTNRSPGSAWTGSPVPSAAPSTYRLTVAGRVQEAINRHVAQGGGPNDPNDPLSGFTRAQLNAAARANNITIARGTPPRRVSAQLITALAPPPPPPPTPATPRTPSIDPAVKAAQDVLYGVDPKAKTATRQLQVYGAMRKTQFDTLAVHEQQAVLADLSFIATTAKGPNKTKADRVLNQFTPAGTPMGTTPPGAAQIVGPANGTQTRLPSPQTGLLKHAQNTGVRGDTWVSGTAGGAVWGEYGSGGILLRHVDAQGVERFLMTQRGPGVSDPGKWSYPGGAFESLEDFYQGSTREVAEELGFTDTHFSGAEVHGYHVFERPDVQAKDGSGGTKPWTYHSIAADVPTMITPNLSTSGARAETSDAKWMTRAEIDRLDQQGKLHAPVAGGKLQRNVMSLFPTKPAVTRPGPVTKRPPRLTGTPSVPQRVSPHKPSLGRDLISDQASKDKLRQDVKHARAAYAGKAADERLAAIGAMQGFDDVPTVATKAEIDRLLATGDYIEAWRGQRGAGGGWRSGRGGAVTSSKTAAQVNEELRSGPAWYGEGMFGNGYYFASDKSIARGYSDGTRGSLVRALIPKTAKSEKHGTVERRAHAASSPTSRARGRRHEEGTLYDEGRYAAAVGLDVVEIGYNSGTSHIATPSRPAYLVVNRSILIVEEA